MKRNSLARQKQTVQSLEKQFNDSLSRSYRRAVRIGFGESRRLTSLQHFVHRTIDALVESPNQIAQQILELELSYHQAIRESQTDLYNRKVLQVLNSKYQSLKLFYDGLKVKNSNQRRSLFDQVDFRAVLKALPIWAVTAADINQVLPQICESFDLVLIDEASQLDIASAIPVLQRAKRAVIIGDPFQLRHISFLAASQQQSLAKDAGLADPEAERYNYRKNSILDLASLQSADANNVFMLDEHFRSQPEIIAFSNAVFYNNALKIMTRGLVPPAFKTVKHYAVAGKLKDNGTNPKELATVKHLLQDIIVEDRSRKRRRSLGVISPFRKQADYLERELKKAFPKKHWTRHSIKVGTSFTWQGEERDVMFLSFALDDNAHPSAFNYLERPGVLNVAVTRARNQQCVVSSFNHELIGYESLPALYMRTLEKFVFTSKKQLHIEEPEAWKAEVVSHLALHAPNMLLENDILIAGQRLDLLLTQGEKRLCVDLIEIAGTRGQILPLHSVRSLRRIGIDVYYLSITAWRTNPKMELENILAKLVGKP